MIHGCVYLWKRLKNPDYEFKKGRRYKKKGDLKRMKRGRKYWGFFTGFKGIARKKESNDFPNF